MDAHTEHYCKMLGHHVPFSYCVSSPEQRTEQKLCSQIRNCWFEQFDIDAYLEEHFSKEEILKLIEPKRTKMSSLVELIEKAKKASSGPDKDR